MYFILECIDGGFRCLYIAYYFVHETCDKNVYRYQYDRSIRDVFETLKRVDRIIIHMSDIVVRLDTLDTLDGTNERTDWPGLWTGCDSLPVVFDFDCAPGDHRATLRDAGRRGVPRAKNLSHRNQTRARTFVTRTRPKPDRNPSSSFSRVRTCVYCGATARGEGDTRASQRG